MARDPLFTTTTACGVDAALLDLAERQHGLLGRDQALDLGLSGAGWLRRGRNPGWEAISPRVLRRRGSPPTDQQRALAACLDLGADAYVSHESAAALWGVPGYWLSPLQVIVTQGGAPPRAWRGCTCRATCPSRSAPCSTASPWSGPR